MTKFRSTSSRFVSSVVERRNDLRRGSNQLQKYTTSSRNHLSPLASLLFPFGVSVRMMTSSLLSTYLCCRKLDKSLLKLQQPQPKHHQTPPSFDSIVTRQNRTFAVNTNSGKHGREEQGWFSRHKKKKHQPSLGSTDHLRGGNVKYDNTVHNTIKLQICHNEYDTFVIDPDENDTLFYQRAKFTVSSIQEKLNEAYDDYREDNIIEYFDDTVSTWKPLVHINDVLKYRGGVIPFKIRLPRFYDDTPLPPKYLDELTTPMATSTTNGMVAGSDEATDYFKNSLIATTIQTLVILMKYEGYERSDIKQHVLVYTKDEGGRGGISAEVSTRQYIMHRANMDEELQSILLNHPHALQHMIELIHYDFVWNKHSHYRPTIINKNENKNKKSKSKL